MKKYATLVLLLAAIITGTIAAYLANNLIEERVAAKAMELEQRYAGVDVLVPLIDLPAGEMVSTETFSVRTVPADFVHNSAITAGQFDVVAGHRLVFPLGSGEPLLTTHLTQGRGQSFSNMIENGKRALTFPVDVISSVSGMLRPGDRIDLLATLRDGEYTKTFALLADITVMATDDRVDDIDDSGRHGQFQTITLMVGSEDAAKIIHAREEGRLSVLLRSPLDDGHSLKNAITLDVLIGKNSVVKKERAKETVQIIRGGA